jgi:predicted amidophosphoribosyltransferase
MVLALKHGDRLDLARPAGAWMLRRPRPILAPGMLVAPVPLHWLRLLAAQVQPVGAAVGRRWQHPRGWTIAPTCCCATAAPAARRAATAMARFANVSEARSGACRPAASGLAEGRHVLLVDDVMTSGATLAAAPRPVWRPARGRFRCWRWRALRRRAKSL